jgi:nitroimidazol reductase NimA-like FMN-containing flavoprotein (pyridoxamine 5'-phosphate oxidase superfamily)
VPDPDGPAGTAAAGSDSAASSRDAAGAGDAGVPGPDHTRLRRHPERARDGFDELAAVLDAGLYCHLGIDIEGWPSAIPTLYGRNGEDLFLHGSVASRALRTARGGVPLCVTVTLIDAIVLARSVFSHSMNYRSAMVFGRGELVEEREAKLAALNSITEHVAPGQWDYTRQPTDKELAQTSVLRMPIERWSVKVRSGPPGDGDGPDGELGLWAGELPLRLAAGELVAASDGRLGPVPAHLAALGGLLARRIAP